MTSVALLENKVRKWSLPGVQGSPPGAAPLLKRLLLPQGELAQFYDADDGIRYIAFAELVPDKIRGNHYHVRKEEFVYIIQGKTLLVIEDVQSNRRESTSLETGDLVFISTLIAHAFCPTTRGQAVEFSPTRFDALDVHRVQLI